MGILEIAEEMISSNVLPASSRISYVRYIQAGKIVIKNQSVLVFLAKLGRNAPAARTLHITHPNDDSLYIFVAVDIFLMIEATDAFLMNEHKPIHFHASSFLKHAKATLTNFTLANRRKTKSDF